MKKILLALLLVFIQFQGLNARETIEPDGTYLYATKDGEDLYLDIYDSKLENKGTVLFMFGGGFISGKRNEPIYQKWFRMLTDSGYQVVSIDYRLGLKGKKNPGMNIAFIKALKSAIKIAVEDLYSATVFLIDNAQQLKLDPGKLIISGASAGAITVMQGEWHICNGHSIAQTLPEGFNYAGVMSFSGAIFSDCGNIKYKSEPCPTLMFHGTADKIVNYNKIKFFKLCFAGTGSIAKVFIKNNFNYNILRFDGKGHEIAISMVNGFKDELRFLEENISKGVRRNVDALIKDPTIETPNWAKGGYKQLYD